MTLIPPHDDRAYERKPKASKLWDDIQALSDNFPMRQIPDEKISRYATLELTREFSIHAPVGSLEELLQHPDLPDDVEPVCVLAMTTPSVRIIVASAEWDECEEGATPPPMELHYQRDEEGKVSPQATGTKPQYPPRRVARLKFTCLSSGLREGEEGVADISFEPVYCGSKENEEFWRWTPGGSLNFQTINAGVAGKFEEGKEYYIDITPAE